MTAPCRPSAHALVDLAAVRNGALVSRILLKNAVVSATLSASGAGAGLSEHATPADALDVGLEVKLGLWRDLSPT